MDTQIIEAVLSKNASSEEARSVAEWFATDEGQEYLSQRFDREASLLNEQLMSEWSDHDIPGERMQMRFGTQLKMKARTFRFKVIAAALLPFLLLAGVFTFVAGRSGVFSGGELAEVTVPYGEQLRIVLQDGTLVQLNSGSRLWYPKSFGLFNRKVQLAGEAYFSVSKDRSRPFIVALSEIKVRVTGTKFNVKAYPEDSKIAISLEEGSVNITDKNKNVYPLKVGQNADFDKRSGVLSVSGMDDITQHTAWRTKSLNFYRTPLQEILKTLERQYEVQFTVNDSTLLNYKFSISTSKVNVNDILKDLEKVSTIRFNQKYNNNYDVLSLK